MPSVFPIQPSYGYAAQTSFDELLRIYPDLSYRRYIKSTAAHKVRAMRFEELSQAEYDSIEAFFIARKQSSGSGFQFYVYDPNVVNAPDLTGAATTGRHTAIFVDPEISFTRDGPCTYSGELNVLFLD